MKYRICKNMNGRYKIQYKRSCVLWWSNLTVGYGRGLQTVLLDTLEQAEERIVSEKQNIIRKRIAKENNARNRSWSCMGEY